MILFFNIQIFAQVGFNTETPDPSASLEVYSKNMGVSFPHIYLTSLNDATTIPNAKESLIIYNTNPSISGKQGYYYWSGTKWEYIFSDTNVKNLMNHVKSFSNSSTTVYQFLKTNNQFYGETNHVIGENINSTWTEITDFTKNIDIDRPNNQMFLTISGMIQANNSSTSGRIATSFGFFIDDKLVDIKPISLDFDKACFYREFTIYAVVNNITVGSHTVKFAIRNRTENTSQSDLSISFGGKNSASSCNNILTDDEARMSGTIFINQPYLF